MNRRTFLTTLVRAGAAAAVASVFPVPQLGSRPWPPSATHVAPDIYKDGVKSWLAVGSRHPNDDGRFERAMALAGDINEAMYGSRMPLFEMWRQR